MRLQLSFKDNGIGISPENLNRIFEMFYRASEQSEGSGLGLYIVRNAVEKLGGQLTVASKPGAGTTFQITLPNKADHSLY
jgi:signal transduction histidine kinase